VLSASDCRGDGSSPTDIRPGFVARRPSLSKTFFSNSLRHSDLHRTLSAPANFSFWHGGCTKTGFE
jgi:hypothetical protein